MGKGKVKHGKKSAAKKAARSRLPIEAKPALRASYDAAQIDDDNRKYWKNADSLSARAANSLPVRMRLRQNARHEYANNSYMDGIVQSKVNHMVGSGPRLQVTTPDTELNGIIETKFANWVRAARWIDQLRVMGADKIVTGEPFGVLCLNPMIADPVQLDVRIVECDHFTNGIWGESGQRNNVDGIIFDQWGNPSTYDVLREHPGDRFGLSGNYDRLPASRVLHWFRMKRPGQVRGIPEVTPGLPLFAMLRDFCLATLTSAQTAAYFSAVLESESTEPPSDDLKMLDIVRGMMAELPAGRKLHQFQSTNPNTTYEMFVKCILREIARCLCIPWHLASGDYTDSNYATARLGSQDFRHSIKVERQDCECEVLDPIFAAWLHEAMLIPGYLPQSVWAFRDPHLEEVMAYQRSYRGIVPLPHKFTWPAWDYIDPQTEAAADTERLNNGTESLQSIADSRGKDWREVARQRIVEEMYVAEVRAELGQKAPTAKPEVLPPPDNAPRMITQVPAVEASAVIEGCGGKGGTPGPCPQGGARTATSGGGSSKSTPRPSVDAVAGKIKTLASGKLSGPHTKALARDMAGMTTPELKELKTKLGSSVTPEKAHAAKATASAAVAKARANPKPVPAEVIKPTADLSDRAASDPKVSYDEIKQHVAGLGKKSKGELTAIAKSVQVTPASKDTKAVILQKIETSIANRKGRSERTQVPGSASDTVKSTANDLRSIDSSSAKRLASAKNLGEQVSALGDVDAKVLDDNYSKMPGVRSNEVFRSMDGALRGWDEGVKTPASAEVATRRIQDAKERLPAVVSGLRKLGLKKEADFYERHGAAVADALLAHVRSGK